MGRTFTIDGTDYRVINAYDAYDLIYRKMEKVFAVDDINLTVYELEQSIDVDDAINSDYYLAIKH